MNTREVNESIEALRAYWPRPAMPEEEVKALAKELKQFSAEIFAVVLDGFTDRPFRPLPAEVLSSLRAAKRHEDPSSQRPPSYDHVDCRECHILLGRFMERECPNGLQYLCPLRAQYPTRVPTDEDGQLDFLEGRRKAVTG